MTEFPGPCWLAMDSAAHRSLALAARLQIARYWPPRSAWLVVHRVGQTPTDCRLFRYASTGGCDYPVDPSVELFLYGNLAEPDFTHHSFNVYLWIEGANPVHSGQGRIDRRGQPRPSLIYLMAGSESHRN